MADPTLTAPDGKSLNLFHRAQGKKLREGDVAPKSLDVWRDRRTNLRQAMLKAMGGFPDKAADIDAKVVGTLKRTGYRIENIVIQTRPDVWMTANAYIPDPAKGKLPAVLSVHGHYQIGRRDPNIQARCLGLVQQGYFVLCVDAFGAGERFMKPTGGYHGSLIGSTLWPVGQTLLGLQVYDNRRAVDYLLTRPEVDGDRLAITGESGGGNQTMNAGAMDDRFAAVVPVCSVGNYQAYLQAACCVCEVLPNALTFTEEGDVLGLVAPRALMVINATRDGIQFSVDEAKKSLARASDIYALYKEPEKVKHVAIEAGHGYNKDMRQAMYGWMARWLKNEGKGEPIEEPKFTAEKIEDLSCFTGGMHPKGFLFPASFAAREAERLLKPFAAIKPDHAEEWESTATAMKTKLKATLGGIPALEKPFAQFEKNGGGGGGEQTRQALLRTEGDLAMPVELRFKPVFGKMPSAIVLDLDGKEAAGKNALVPKLIDKGFVVVLPELRGTGKSWPTSDKGRAGSDHDPAEHGVWIGRPLLGQWVTDLIALLDWLDLQPGHDRKKRAIVTVGQAGLVGLCAMALSEDRVTSLALLNAPASYVTSEPYGTGTRMGLLAPGLLKVGDVPHLAGLIAPRPLQIVEGVTPLGAKLEGDELKKAYGFTATIYQLHKAEKKFEIGTELKLDVI